MRRKLIAMREELGLTREELAHKLGVNPKSVQRWETGESTPQMPHRVALAEALERPLADILRALDDDDAGPLNGHRVSRLGHLVSLEQAAGELWTFETTVVPGLLQLPEYATVVERVAPDRPSAADVARRVALRMRRQAVLHSLTLRALLDASVLERTTGGSEIMAAQLAHLRDMARRPNIEVRVLPLDERAHAAGQGAFTLVTSPDDRVPFMAVTFSAAGVQYFDSEPAVRAHVDLWGHLWRISHDMAKVELQR